MSAGADGIINCWDIPTKTVKNYGISCENLLSLAVTAARERASLGEISDAMEKVFGRYQAQIKSVSGGEVNNEKSYPLRYVYYFGNTLYLMQVSSEQRIVFSCTLASGLYEYPARKLLIMTVVGFELLKKKLSSH